MLRCVAALFWVFAFGSLVGGHFSGVQWSHCRSGKLQSFFACAIAPETFLREVPLSCNVSSSAYLEADADVSGANSSPPSHSTLRARTPLVEEFLNERASKVGLELAPAGGISNAELAFGSNNRH